MKHRALAALGLLLAACSHDEHASAPSASAVDNVSDTPSNNPDFTPPENGTGDVNDAGVQTAPAGNTTSTTGTTNAPASGPGNTTANAAGTARAAADNTDVNERDRSRSAVTPMDQGESEADRTITQQIRQAVMRDKSLSFNAKNVKIITLNHQVTLRGPVKSAAERTAIESAAKQVAGVSSVENQLEIAN